MLPAIVFAAAAAATPKPMRHLEFSFHFADVEARDSERGPVMGGGYDGVIFVDVVGVGPSDSLELAMTQHVPLAHSLDASSARILTFPTGQVDLPAGSPPLSEPELNLARFLGRKFINGDYLDSNNHWHIDIKLSPNASASTDFTIDKNVNGILDITESQTITAQLTSTHTDGHIVYDMNRTVPVSIHEEKRGTSGVDLTYDYRLTGDSLASLKP
jgi:hypothetical protein